MKWPSWLSGRTPATAVFDSSVMPYYADLPDWTRPPVLSGILVERMNYSLVAPDDERRGVKLVTVPADLLSRYEIARELYDCVQDELQRLPQSLQPRRRKAVPASPMSANTPSTESE